MTKSFNIFILVLFAFIDISLCELKKISIKSHKVISQNITENRVNNIYDNSMSTVGSFYHASSKYVKVDFDLGANYIIEKIVATTKHLNSSAISFVVGNLINNEGGLLYDCSNGLNAVLECIPKCSSRDSTRNGIVSRKVLMSLHVDGKWTSIYELEVYGRIPNEKSDFISESRLVIPENCDSKSWLLTSSSSEIKPIAHSIGTKIFLEKRYILTEIHVQFAGKVPDDLKFQLTNEHQKHKNITISMDKCTSLKSTFICQIHEAEFPTRVVTIGNDGLSHLWFRGKIVFYPTISVKASADKKDSLKLTCEIDECDSLVHSDCSDKTMKSAMQIPCNNKRLIRMSSNDKEDSLVIVNQGSVEKTWADTKFAVESDETDKMVVSMPRTYQYFGQYRCSCIVGDDSMTEINSKITTLKESDFIEKGIIFETKTQYKLEDSDSIPFKESVNNLIIIPGEALKSTYISAKIYALSLIDGISINGKFPMEGGLTESVTFDSGSSKNIKAFANNSNSWSVKVFKYVASEMYPEFEHNANITINFESKKYNRTQTSVTRFIKINKNSDDKPEILKVVTDKLISLKTVYNSAKEIKLIVQEQTCKKNSNKTLAVLDNSKCNAFDSQASCLNSDGLVILSIKKERNVETTYIYSLVETVSNKSLSTVNISPESIVLNEKDIKMKMRFIDINSDPSNPQATNLKVEIEFISKVIADFIPCGNVLLKIREPNNIIKKLVLQSTKCEIPLVLSTERMEVSLTLTIEGLNVTYEKVLNIINPTVFPVKNVKIEGSKKMYLSWTGIEKVAHELLVGYQVTTTTTIIACNSSQVNTTTILKNGNIITNNIYRYELGAFNRNHTFQLDLQVQPIFKNNKQGQSTQLTKSIKYSRDTKIHFNKNILPKRKSVTIEPSQLNIPCPIKSVDFVLESSNVEHVKTNISETNKLQYTFNELIPGRQYKLSATVQYQYGSPDSISKIYTFETADDISILQAKHVAEVYDDVNITCTADVGPLDKYRKTVEWRRADNSPLPDGVNSVPSTDKPNLGFLIMRKAVADFSGDYGCFVKPSAKIGGAKITVIINDLEVSPKNNKVDFSKPNDAISVKCYSSSVGEGALVWTDGDNLEIKEGETENYKVSNDITKEKAINSVLVIKKPSLKTSGVYHCSKSFGDSKASKTFSLYGEENLSIESLSNKTEYVGEKTRLRCSAKLAHKNQKVTWGSKSIVENGKQLLKTHYPNPSDTSVQEIEVINNMALPQVSCELTPAVNEMNIPLKKVHQIKLLSKIKVDGPTNVKEGQSVTLTCIGHHRRSTDILQWIFYKKESINSTSSHGKIVLTSESLPKPLPYEPIKLVLSMQKINGTEAGRYDCEFKSELKTEMLTKKSLSLIVDVSNEGSVARVQKCENCPNKEANAIFSSKPFYFLLASFALLFFRF